MTEKYQEHHKPAHDHETAPLESNPTVLKETPAQKGVLKYWVTPKTAAILILMRRAKVLLYHEDEWGFQYLELLFRGKRVVSAGMNLAEFIFPPLRQKDHQGAQKRKEARAEQAQEKKQSQEKDENGIVRYWVNPNTMAKLLLKKETKLFKYCGQEDGSQYLEVIFRDKHVVTVARKLAHLLLLREREKN